MTDLRDAAARERTLGSFGVMLVQIAERHAKRPAFQDRLKKANLNVRPPTAT